ncbi:MAG: TraR/DksA family transcriptional regulator [Pirellulales bacterium]
MTQPDFTLYRERLLVLRARLQGDMTQMEDNALNKDHAKTTSMPNHMAELGSGNFDQELTLSVLGREKDALSQIDAALKRIEDGSYGRCETCDETLSNARLEAIPYPQSPEASKQPSSEYGRMNHGGLTISKTTRLARENPL